VRITCLEARELAGSDPATYRLVSDREPIGWLSVLLERADATLFADLLEDAWRLRAEEATSASRQARQGRKSRPG
jgi:hypothetical protein